MNSQIAKMKWVIAGMMLLGLGYVLGLSAPHTQAHQEESAQKPGSILEQDLADMKDRHVSIVRLKLGPGASFSPHRHPGHVFVYVLEGTMETKLNDEKIMTHKAGEAFYEPPMGLHTFSRNPGETGDVTALAFFINDATKPATVPEN